MQNIRSISAADFLRNMGGGYFRLGNDASLSVVLDTQIFDQPGKMLSVDPEGIYHVIWEATPQELAKEASDAAIAAAQLAAKSPA